MESNNAKGKRIQIGKMKFNIELEVKDYLGNALPLKWMEKESTENDLMFQGKFTCLHDEKDFCASVKVVTEDNSEYIELSCEVDPDSGWQRRYTFHPYDSILLRLKPVEDCNKIFGSQSRLKGSDCWSGAFFADGFSKIPQNVASMVWKSDQYYHILPLVDGDFKSEIRNVDGDLAISVSPCSGGFTKIKAKALVITWGEDPYKTAERNVNKGYEILDIVNAARKNTRLSEIFDYLGWCSWDSMALQVHSAGILEKAEEFKEKNIPVRWILIDDGWYPEDKKRRILDFKEKKEPFPEGFKKLTSELKNRYGMKYVGIWQCYTGGWNGMAPDSPITQTMADIIEKNNMGIIVPRTDEGGSFRYWNARNEYLAKCGFDFSKVDVECSISGVTNDLKPVGRTLKEAFRGLEGSVGIYFDGACIHCTAMGPEFLWSRTVGMVNRNSVDFNPADVKSMKQFVCDNIFNSYYHSRFCDLDWDMMWSDSPTTKLNIVMHSLSGGCVYLSEPAGRSKRENIMPFCLSDGRLLKCDNAIMPAEDSLFADPIHCENVLKAWNTQGDSGYLGIFNLYEGEKTISGRFAVDDIHGIAGDKFLVYDWFSKKSFLSDKETRHEVSVEPYDAKMYVATPYRNGIALIGNIDKYVPSAVMENVIYHDDLIMLGLKEGGQFAFAADEPLQVSANGVKIDVVKHDHYSVADCSGIKGKVILTIERKIV